MAECTTNVPQMIIQPFPTEDAAIRAIRELYRLGFARESISVIARDRPRADAIAGGTGVEVAEGAGVGALTGGAIGVLAGLIAGAGAVAVPALGLVIAGPLAAAVVGAGTGVVTGGFVGALVALGVTDEDAWAYADRFRAGDILVVVEAGDRTGEARRILDTRADGLDPRPD